MGNRKKSLFLGTHRHRLDEKGRLVLPAEIRARLGRRVVLTGGFDRCIAGFTPEDHEAFVTAEIERRSPLGAEARRLARFFHGQAVAMDLDAQGRILLPANLRDEANLHIEGGEIVVVGVGRRFEIWASKAWEEYLRQTRENLETTAASLASEVRV